MATVVQLLRTAHRRAAARARRCDRVFPENVRVVQWQYGLGSAVAVRRLGGSGGWAAAGRAAALAGAGSAVVVLRQGPGQRWVSCAAPLELDDGLAVGMDLIDTLVAHGQRRRIYDEKAVRYDGSPLWLALSNFLRRMRERGLHMFGCCAAMAASVWAQADVWTVGGSTLAWTSGTAAVSSALLAVLLAVQRLVFGAPVSVPRKTVSALDTLWRERTEVEDQLLREIIAAAGEDGSDLQLKQPASLSHLGCSGQWWMVQRAAVVSPLPSPPKSSGSGKGEPTPTEQEYTELFRYILAACGYHSWLCMPPRRQRQFKNGKPRPPPSLRFSSDVLEEWSVPMQLLPSTTSESRHGDKGDGRNPEPEDSVDKFAVAATGLSLHVVVRHRGRGGGPAKASDGPEIIFASCEFTAHPASVERSIDSTNDGRDEVASVGQVVKFDNSSDASIGGRQRVVLVDKWSVAGGPANDRELKAGLAPLRLVLDGVTLTPATPQAVRDATTKRQMLYFGQGLVG